MSTERVMATFIDPATRQRIPLSTKDNKPVSVISLYNNGLGCVCKPADNSSVGYDTVRNGLLSALARRVLLDGYVDPESDFCKTYFDKYQLTTYELEQLASKPALTFDPSCHRVYTEMRNLRFKEVSGDPTVKAKPEEVMDFEDDGPDCVRYGMQSKLKWTAKIDAEKNSPFWEIEQKKLKGTRHVKRNL